MRKREEAQGQLDSIDKKMAKLQKQFDNETDATIREDIQKKIDEASDAFSRQKEYFETQDTEFKKLAKEKMKKQQEKEQKEKEDNQKRMEQEV